MPIPTPPTNPTNLALVNVVPQQSVTYTPVEADLANGNMFLNDGTSLLAVFNDTNPPAVATITMWAVPDEAGRTGTEANAVAVPNASIGYQTTVAAAAKAIFGPFRQAWWNQTSINVGYVYISVSTLGDVAGCKLAVINY